MNKIAIMSNEDVASYILEISKPINVKIIEYLGKFGILRRFSPYIQGLFITFLIMLVGLPWILIGLREGPNSPLAYILGYIAVGNVLYSSLMGTYILYNRAKARLSELVRHLRIGLPPIDLQIWNDMFSTRKQFLSGMAIALFGSVLVGFTTIVTDKTDPITIGSATLGGYLAGFIVGNGIHMFVNFPSVATRFYLVNIHIIYRLAPVETAGLIYLFSITVDFMIIGSLVTASSLLTLIWYLVNASSYFSGTNYFPAVIGAIFAVIIAAIMLFRSINIFTNHMRKEKLNVLSELQDLINKKYEELNQDKHDADIYEKIGKLTTIYNSVKSSPSWPFEATVARNALVSFLVPFFPALVQLAIDWISK